VGRRRFANHGSITLSRGWLCQKWKSLETLYDEGVLVLFTALGGG